MTRERTVRVVIEREFQIPEDILAEGDATDQQLDERATDYFWNYWGEFLAEEPVKKDDIQEVTTHAE